MKYTSIIEWLDPKDRLPELNPIGLETTVRVVVTDGVSVCFGRYDIKDMKWWYQLSEIKYVKKWGYINLPEFENQKS